MVRRRVTSAGQQASFVWRPLHPELARDLSDARMQLHHAAQLVSAMGISYLPHAADDSHTNLGWIDGDVSALASHVVTATPPIQLAVRPDPFALLVLEGGEPCDVFALHGRTVSEAETWVRQQLSARRLDAATYTLKKHYTIPPHPVDGTAAFDASAASAFEQLRAWYADASVVIEALVAKTPNSSPVRCWPHHFDIATLIEVAPKTETAPQKTISLGMEPGDGYYAEPYFYASMYPSPSAVPQVALDGGGTWHSHEWIGAVLPGSRVSHEDQRAQLTAFVESAARESRSALRG